MDSLKGLCTNIIQVFLARTAFAPGSLHGEGPCTPRRASIGTLVGILPRGSRPPAWKGVPWPETVYTPNLLPGLYGHHCAPTILPSHRHTPIKSIPIHSTSYRRLDYIPKRGQLKNKPRRLNKPPKHCTSISVHVTFVVLWASMVLPWPLWASLGIYATAWDGRLWPNEV